MSESSENIHNSIVTGGSDLKQRPPQVRTRDEAKKFLLDALDLLKKKRIDCDVMIPGNPEMTAKMQQKAFRKFLLHVGVVMGESTAFFCSGLLDEGGYDLIHQEALNTLAGKVVGHLDGKGFKF